MSRGRRGAASLLVLLVAALVAGAPASTAAFPARASASARAPASAVVRASASTRVPSAAPATLLAQRSPFDGSEDDEEAPDDAAPSTGTPTSSPRLDRLIATLRREPLAVDPELEWIFDAPTRARLLRTLERSPVPAFVAVLPLLEEDESGGDGERVIAALQRGVGRPGVYVVSDERGRFELASVGVRRSLEIPYGLLRPAFDDRPLQQRSAEPGPPDWTTIPDRLTEIVETAARSGPGTPNGLVEQEDALGPLRTPDYAAERSREDSIALSIMGLIAGVVLGLVVIGGRGLVRAVGDGSAAAAGGTGRGGRSAGREGRTGDTGAHGPRGRGRHGRRGRRRG